MKRSVMALAAALVLFGAGAARAEDSSASSAAKAAPAARLALPSCLLEATKKTIGFEDVEKLPLATVVSLAPTWPRAVGEWFDKDTNAAGQWVCVPWWTEKTPVLDGIVTGTRLLPGPVADQPAALLLAGPSLNSGEFWAPAELSVDAAKKTITVVAEEWTDNGGRKRNVTGRNLFLLNLGKLAAGQWELRVHVRKLFCNRMAEQQFYTLHQMQVATGKILVGKDVQDLLPPVIELKDLALDLNQAALLAEAKGRQWQRPNWGGEMVEREMAVAHAAQVRVGNFDGHNEKAVAEFLLGVEQAAHREEEGNGGPLVVVGKTAYAVVVGPMPEGNSSEQITLREAVWQGDTLTLKVELWRMFSRGLLARPWPLVIAAIETPKPAPAGYTVKVEWASYAASEPGGLYLPDAPPYKTPAAMSVKVRVVGGK